MNKALYSDFASFFEQPTRRKLDDLLRANLGEFDNLDFKGSWPTFASVARHVLALANSRGGTVILGVHQDESGVVRSLGLDKLVDKSDFKKGTAKYLPSTLRPELLDFALELGKDDTETLFQVIIVEDLPARAPFVCCADGKGIRKAAIYVRNGTSSEEVNYDGLQKLLSRRIETQHSSTVSLSLDEHLDQLEKLYERIPRYVDPEDIMMGMDYPCHPAYPKESCEAYVARLIERKKELIEAMSEKL